MVVGGREGSGHVPVRRQVFRIEQMLGVEAAPVDTPAEASSAGGDLIGEIQALRHLLEASHRTGHDLSDAYSRQTAETEQLKEELARLHGMISRTREELAALHPERAHGSDIKRMSHELDAVAADAETTTQRVLNAAERIDDLAATLIAAIKSKHNQGLARDIQEEVVRIYEACNFQDVAGQRITKAITTIKAVEDRLSRLIAIWGGNDQLNGSASAPSDRRLVNGPKLGGDVGHASQDEIDRLFDPGSRSS
jgi:chemotaxis protein CheZ